MAYNIYNYTEVSKVLTSNPKQVTKGYNGKKYKTAIQELKKFQIEWIKKWGKNNPDDMRNVE